MQIRAIDHTQLATCFDIAEGILRPPPLRSADEWADEHRVLPAGSPEPGRWRTDRVPYTREIYRAFSDYRVRTVIVVMGSQMSKTEIMLNVIGHRFTDGPFVPCLYIGPTEKNVRSMSRDRIMRMIRSTPALWQRLERGASNKITEKWLAGIRLGFAWAGSATELASHPAGLVLADERDRMLSDVGQEGDPIELAAARGSNFVDFKLGVFSTPTVQGASPIWSLYEDGTKLKWAWPCPSCGEFFVPYLRLLTYDDSGDTAQLRRTATVACPHCGAAIEDRHKRAMNAGGKYLPHKISSNGEHIQADHIEDNPTASFWVSGLASPWQSFADRAEALSKAYHSHEPARIQAVINTGFGELWQVHGEAPPWQDVFATREPLARGALPTWSRLVTMGVDVQKRGLYYVVRAWGENQRSHMVDHGYILGDTEYDDVWLMWQQILTQTIEGKPVIDVAFIDSGYKPGSDRYRRPEHKVYDVVRRLRGRAYAAKGHDTLERPVRASDIDVTISGRTIKNGVRLWHVDSSHMKTWIHAQIMPSPNGDRLWTTHTDVDEDYCRQIVAEELVTKASGLQKWICPNHRANHYLDCEVLARAAAMSRQVQSIAAIRPQEAGPVATEHRRPPQTGGWFSKYRR